MATPDSTPTLDTYLEDMTELAGKTQLLAKVIQIGAEGPDQHEVELTPGDAWMAGYMLSDIAEKMNDAISGLERLGAGGLHE